MIPGATAEIALHLLANDFGGDRARVRGNQVYRRHDHARGTKSALQPVMFMKCALHRMELVAIRQAFDCFNRGAISLYSEHGAGFYRCSINMDNTAAALGSIAANMRAG